MKKVTPARIFSLVAATLIVTALGFTALNFSPCIEVEAMACGPITKQNQSTVELAPGYYQYSPTSLESAKNEGKVVLYFWAPWCSSCTSLDIELQDEKASIPEGVTVLRINYDTAAELKTKYGVVTQHTFVQVDQSGNALATWVGGDIENFAKFLK